MNQFMVIKKPGTVDYHNPTKTYPSKEQAIAVAKELASKSPSEIYCVVKIIAEAKVAQVTVEEYE